ncbi:hypothetical protein [Streptomyces erythrochromogenes]|uniref:hypothetical protein n=1 Tax=Streptomyces erythrochromogenes TaxID=285574 RepID=UPI003804538A|nr:hypothetical protein OG489_01330 [Streptomyces erythrochromogenes]
MKTTDPAPADAGGVTPRFGRADRTHEDHLVLGHTPFGPAARRGRWLRRCTCGVFAGLMLAVVTPADAADSAPYTCGVTPDRFDRCDRVYTSPGETVTVQVNNTGTVSQGDFQAVNRGTGDVLGTVQDVTPSSGAAVLWRNDTDQLVIVDMLARSAESGRIHGLLSAAP